MSRFATILDKFVEKAEGNRVKIEELEQRIIALESQSKPLQSQLANTNEGDEDESI